MEVLENFSAEVLATTELNVDTIALIVMTLGH